MPRRRAVVVGAGVFGITAALELRRRGCSVALLDPGPVPHPAASSTDISKIVRMDYGGDAFHTALAEEAIEGWRRWNRAWDRPLFHEDGFLILTSEPMEPGAFEHDGWTLLRERGHPVERIDAQALRSRHPDWNADRWIDGYRNPLGGWAESGEVVRRLAGEAAGAGVELQEGEACEALLERGGRIAGVRTRSGRTVPGDAVVVAAGAWTPLLVPELAEALRPVGQPVLHFRVDDPARWQAPAFPPWAADIRRTGWYGMPARGDGTLKIGHHGAGLPIHPDAPRSVPAEVERRCRAFLATALPELRDAPLIGTRLCLYCDSFDGDLWIDAHPERPGLVVAAGGSGHGFKFAPLLGALIADAVEGGDDPRRARYRWRAPGPPKREAARSEHRL